MANYETGIEYATTPGSDGSAVDSTARAAAAAAQDDVDALSVDVVSNSGAIAANSVSIAAHTVAIDALDAWSTVDNLVGGWGCEANVATLVKLGAASVPTAYGTTPVVRVPSAATFLERQIRVGLVTSAVAGNYSAFRNGGANFLWGTQGWRTRWRFGVAAVSASMRYYFGAQNALPSNVAPSTLLDMLGVGAEAGSSNLQLYRNDASGSATQIDLGASFPAFTVGATYDAEVWVNAGGASGGYRIRRLDVPAETSGTINTNMPTAGTVIGTHCWCTNNTDAAVVAVDLIELRTSLPLA